MPFIGASDSFHGVEIADPTPSAPVNLRDVADASPALTPGILLRGDAPLPGDDPDGYPVPWPPATVVDLRDPKERRGEHPLAAVATLVDAPILRGRAYDESEMPRGLAPIYLGMLDEPSARYLIPVVVEAARGEAPVLVHCAAGKDRTGVAVALILSLLGIERSRIVSDYVRSDAAMPGINARMYATHRELFDPEVLAMVPPDLLHAPADAIEAVLDVWESHSDGAAGWYLEHGGDTGTLAQLRARLLTR